MKLKLYFLSLLVLIFISSIAIAASKEEIDAKTQETLQTFYNFSSAGKVLSDKAAGILIFPSIVKAIEIKKPGKSRVFCCLKFL
jgi:hypothetical protein